MHSSPIFHGSFTIERRFPATPERVFAAWTDPESKARWFDGPPGWELQERSLDVRVGGIEILRGHFTGPTAMETVFTAHYHHVQPALRLVFVYDMHLNDAHHSTSLVTVEFRLDAGGTAQRYHEQMAFLDGTTAGKGLPSREQGVGAHLDRLHTLFV